MKFLVSALMVLTSASAMALNANSSWSKIFAAKNVTLVYEENLGQIKLWNACLSDSEVRTIKPMRHCTELVPVEKRQGDNVFTDWVCRRWETSDLTYSRTSTRPVCTDYVYEDQNLVCKNFEQRETTVGDSIKVSVVEDHGESTTFPGFVKYFTFPACGSLD